MKKKLKDRCLFILADTVLAKEIFIINVIIKNSGLNTQFQGMWLRTHQKCGANPKCATYTWQPATAPSYGKGTWKISTHRTRKGE